jgi:hypothetical protein
VRQVGAMSAFVGLNVFEFAVKRPAQHRVSSRRCCGG